MLSIGWKRVEVFLFHGASTSVSNGSYACTECGIDVYHTNNKANPVRIFGGVRGSKKKKAFLIPEESEQFRFLRAACYANIKGSVGLILAKHADIYTALFVISAVYTSPAFHEVQTCCTTLSSFPRIYSSVICLSGTCGVFFI